MVLDQVIGRAAFRSPRFRGLASLVPQAVGKPWMVQSSIPVMVGLRQPPPNVPCAWMGGRRVMAVGSAFQFPEH